MKSLESEVAKVRRLYPILTIVVVLVSVVTYSCCAAHSQSAAASLSSEQRAVYADFMKSINKTGFKYLSNKTFQLQLAAVGKDSVCLQGIQLDSPNRSEYPFIH